MSLKKAAEHLASKGRGPDSMLVHMAPSEVAGLQSLAKAAGGSLTIHPETGLPEAGFLQSILPTIIGAGLAATGVGLPLAMAGGALAGAATNKENPMMGAISGGLGAYGGAGLAQGLGALGTQAAGTAAGTAATQAAGSAATGSTGTLATTAAEEAARQQAMEQSLSAAAKGAAAPPPTTWAGVKEGAAQLANAEPGAWGKFVGQAATKDAAATGMGGLGGLAQTGMAAAAPVLMATPEGPEAPDYGPMPEYEFDWNSVYAPGGGFTRKMAAGGETAPKMSGASAQAMDYLMGRASVSPQALAVQQRVAAAPKVVPTTTKATLPASKGDAPAYTFDPMTKQFTAAPVVATPSPFAASEPQEYDYRFAQGGQLQAGGFVVPADVVSALGNGSSSAGLETLARKFGARPIKGPGDGMSDSIPTSIDGRQKARVARDEAYVPPDRVQAAGGAKKLYAMMDRIRSQAHGKTSQQRKINPDRLV